MNHQREIKKFLKGIITAKSKTDESDYYGDVKIGRVPEELVNVNEDKEINQISISGNTYFQYISIIKLLRGDQRTEYLKDKELEENLWYLLCDIYINKKKYIETKQLNERITTFFESLYKPLDTVNIFFRIYNLDLKEYPIHVWDFKIDKIDKINLTEMFSNPKDLISLNILNEFSDKPLMIFEEKGNNHKLIAQRARAKANFNLCVLQTYLSNSPVLHDEHLLFELSESAMIQKKNVPKQTGWSWNVKRKPYGLNDLEHFSNFLNINQEQFQIIKNSNLKIRDVFERAIYWFGKSISEEEYDDKVIALCTSMESLLTTISDEKKGESLAYRMILLNSIVKKPFINPERVIFIYELRSKVVHGSELFICTKQDYFSIRLAVKDILYNFLELQKIQKFKKISEFIKYLETSEEVQKTIEWLKNFNNKYTNRIKAALITKQKNPFNQNIIKFDLKFPF